jgi:hypothetical protein
MAGSHGASYNTIHDLYYIETEQFLKSFVRKSGFIKIPFMTTVILLILTELINTNT